MTSTSMVKTDGHYDNIYRIGTLHNIIYMCTYMMLFAYYYYKQPEESKSYDWKS